MGRRLNHSPSCALAVPVLSDDTWHTSVFGAGNHIYVTFLIKPCIYVCYLCSQHQLTTISASKSVSSSGQSPAASSTSQNSEQQPPSDATDQRSETSEQPSETIEQKSETSDQHSEIVDQPSGNSEQQSETSEEQLETSESKPGDDQSKQTAADDEPGLIMTTDFLILFLLAVISMH